MLPLQKFSWQTWNHSKEKDSEKTWSWSDISIHYFCPHFIGENESRDGPRGRGLLGTVVFVNGVASKPQLSTALKEILVENTQPLPETTGQTAPVSNAAGTNYGEFRWLLFQIREVMCFSYPHESNRLHISHLCFGYHNATVKDGA